MDQVCNRKDFTAEVQQLLVMYIPWEPEQVVPIQHFIVTESFNCSDAYQVHVELIQIFP